MKNMKIHSGKGGLILWDAVLVGALVATLAIGCGSKHKTGLTSDEAIAAADAQPLEGISSIDQTEKDLEALPLCVVYKEDATAIDDETETVTEPKDAAVPATGNQKKKKKDAVVVTTPPTTPPATPPADSEDKDDKADEEKPATCRKNPDMPGANSPAPASDPAPAPAPAPVPAPAAQASLIEGQKIYKANCESCHGALPGEKQGRTAAQILAAASIGPHKGLTPWPAVKASSLSPELAAASLEMALK